MVNHYIMNSINIGIIGLGTVGSGVVKILQAHPDRMQQRSGSQIQIKKIVVRDATKARDVETASGIVTEDLDAILTDASISIVIQLIGGLEPARSIMLSLLEAGKDVVTANKALLSEHGDELFAKARERNRTISFEASVAGGIPIIAAITQSMTANQISSIEAILNGTSNFILTEMLNKQRTYDEALKQAQDLGYAEADPSMDVDGTDASQKLVILTRLAFGAVVNTEQFLCQGIDHLDLTDLQYANELGYTVKLLAVARLHGDQLEMHVQPTLLRHDRPLAKIDGAYNMIALEGDAVGKTWYSGPGAGQLPTASAVVADLIDVIVGRGKCTFPHLEFWPGNPPFQVQSAEQVRRRYYLRFNAEDKPHVLADIADILGKQNISIASLIQHEPAQNESASDDVSSPIVPLVIMTHHTTEGQMQAADEKLSQLNSLRPPHIRMPVAD